MGESCCHCFYYHEKQCCCKKSRLYGIKYCPGDPHYPHGRTMPPGKIKFCTSPVLPPLNPANESKKQLERRKNMNNQHHYNDHKCSSCGRNLEAYFPLHFSNEHSKRDSDPSHSHSDSSYGLSDQQRKNSIHSLGFHSNSNHDPDSYNNDYHQSQSHCKHCRDHHHFNRHYESCRDHHHSHSNCERCRDRHHFYGRHYCDSHFLVRLGGLHSGMAFRLRQLLECRVKICLDTREGSRVITAKLCMVGSDFIEVRRLVKKAKLKRTIRTCNSKKTKKSRPRNFRMIPFDTIKWIELDEKN